jgi:hypothetical protein
VNTCVWCSRATDSLGQSEVVTHEPRLEAAPPIEVGDGQGCGKLLLSAGSSLTSRPSGRDVVRQVGETLLGSARRTECPSKGCRSVLLWLRMLRPVRWRRAAVHPSRSRAAVLAPSSARQQLSSSPDRFIPSNGPRVAGSAAAKQVANSMVPLARRSGAPFDRRDSPGREGLGFPAIERGTDIMS